MVLHEVHARTDVFLLRCGDELEGERVPTGCDTVSAGIVRTIERAVLRARRIVGARRGVPLIAGVAVSVVVGNVEPAPVGVKDDRTRLQQD